MHLASTWAIINVVNCCLSCKDPAGKDTDINFGEVFCSDPACKMFTSIKQRPQEEMVQYIHLFTDLPKLNADTLRFYFVNSIYNNTLWDKENFSIMSGDVISLELSQELALHRDRYKYVCFEYDNSVANPGALSYVNMVTAKYSLCKGNYADHKL